MRTSRRKPHPVKHAARAALVLAACTVAVLMLGPFQGAERLFYLSDKQAHAIAFFWMTLLSFLAAPRMRRTDLALVLVALGAAAEVAQALVGRDAGVGDLLADSVGVFAAWAPSYVSRLRRRMSGMEPRRRASDHRRRAPARDAIP